eukprot:TRINITY_DN17459_c0_g1_i1.p2 TRINITY_DN17459_c0_g1~~TRINITY_DN17459_c0_g1_i1.p2  ORF type:complete len:297 (-),score=62.05 TRINITY_DN17459_c0_g1_i1:1245-2135(-)
MAPPLYLETFNRIVYDTVLNKIKNGDEGVVEMAIADYDQAMWHLSSAQDDPFTITISLNLKCWNQLQAAGAINFLKSVYGPLLVQPEQGYNATIKFNAKAAPLNGGTPESFAMRVASLHRNFLAAPLVAVMDAVQKKVAMNMIQIDYRPMESFWVKPMGDRVMVIFSISFDDPDDVVMGKVFLQEFSKNLSGAPAVDVKIKDAPLELRGVPNLRAEGYATFLLEARHFDPKQRDKTINMLVQFRNYLHYHLKCSKAYLHIRMRTKVNLLLQVLNRAKQEKLNVEKKTASGRSFVRK